MTFKNIRKQARVRARQKQNRFDFRELETRCLLASVVYNDSLQSGFQNWSWDTTIDLANTDPVQSGTNSIEATFTAGWSGVYLSNPGGIQHASNEEVRFWIRGGSNDAPIRFHYVDSSQNFVPMADVVATAGQWTEIVVDFSAATVPSQINGFVWQEFTGSPGNTIYIDSAETGDFLPDDDDTQDGPTISVDSSIEVRAINDDIYGLNFADEQLASDIGLSVDRWGGNSTSRYNWQVDATNLASDWYFENYPNDTPDVSTLPFGSTSDIFVQKDRTVGADSVMTVGLTGWTAGSREIIGSFAVDKYGPQQDVDPWRPNFGNGVDLNGDYITGNDPFDGSIQSDSQFAADWVDHLVGQYGTAANGGVKYYALDNEPMLWNSTHRDVHPEPASYDEVFNKGVEYATAIKNVDPTAEVLGPTVWGWTAYFYSALDAAAGGAWWNNPQDRNAHGGEAFLPWYLGEMADVEAQTGTRLLDYLDIHFYPQVTGVALTRTGGDAATQEARLESTRALWDSSYTDPSWINDEVQLIPRMRNWIDTHYPGTKLAITEYNWGGVEHISGAVAQADILGIFGREGVDLATMWGPPDADDPTGYAFRMYRNYDGAGENGSRFGDMGVQAGSTDSDVVSAFAATRASDNTMTLMLVNKSTAAQETSLDFAQVDNAMAEVYSYSSNDLGQILREADLSLVDGEADITLPGYSITLLEIPLGETEVTLTPDAIEVTRGVLAAGSVADLGASDNQDLSLRRDPSSIGAVTQFEVAASSPVLNPTSFELTLEGSVFARTAVNQSIRLYDFSAGAWELLDTRAATRFSDSTVTVAASGDLSRFVDTDGSIEAQLTFQSQNPRQQFTSNVDFVSWTVIG